RRLTAIGAARQCCDDAPSARVLVRSVRRPAAEDLSAARGVARAFRVVRASNRERVEMWMTDGVERVVRAADERLKTQRIAGLVAPDNGRRDHMRASFQRNADVGARFDVVPRLRHVLQVGFEVVFTADAGQMDALSVNRVFELMFVLEAANDSEVRAEQLD